MAFTSFNSDRRPFSYSPEYSEQDSSAVDDGSSLASIEQTIAKSQQIIQRSNELTKLNSQRKILLNERVKALIPSEGKPFNADIVPKVSLDELQIPTKRTNFTVLSSSRRSSRERSPDNFTFEDYIRPEDRNSEGDGLGNMKQLHSTCVELKQQLKHHRPPSLRFKEDSTRQAASPHGGTRSQGQTIELMTADLEAAQAELRKVVQVLNDREYYVKAIEDELSEFKSRGSLDIRDTSEYRGLYEKYIDLLEHVRAEGKRAQQSQDPLSQRKLLEHRSPSSSYGGRVNDDSKGGELVGKVTEMETKLSELEKRYHTQLTENIELRKKLVSLLEQTEQGRLDDFRSLTFNSDTRNTVSHLMSPASSKKSFKKISFKDNSSISPLRKKSVKTTKKPKKIRGASGERKRLCKFHCCGKCK